MTTLQALALKACPATSHGEESWRSGTRCVCEAIVGVLEEARRQHQAGYVCYPRTESVPTPEEPEHG